MNPALGGALVNGLELFVGFLLGMAGNLFASVLYDRFKLGRQRRATTLSKRSELWQSYLNSDSPLIRAQAFQEIQLNVFRWYIVGNAMFAISGIVWILDLFTPLYGLPTLLAAIVSVVALLTFGFAGSWIRLYFRHSPTIEKELQDTLTNIQGPQSS
jgi:hypothetical protein